MCPCGICSAWGRCRRRLRNRYRFAGVRVSVGTGCNSGHIAGVATLRWLRLQKKRRVNLYVVARGQRGPNEFCELQPLTSLRSFPSLCLGHSCEPDGSRLLRRFAGGGSGLTKGEHGNKLYSYSKRSGNGPPEPYPQARTIQANRPVESKKPRKQRFAAPRDS